MTTNREHEVVELTIKGCLRILSIDFPKVHDAAFVLKEIIMRTKSIEK